MKKLLSLLIALVAFAIVGCGGGDKKSETKAEPQVLNLFSWADNIDPAVIEKFEKENNCKVNYDVFANNEELLAKLQAGGAQYDIIQPSDYMVTTLVKLGILARLSSSSIPNLTKVVTM